MKKQLVFALSFLTLTSVWSQDNISLITPYDKDTIETYNPLLAWYYLDGMVVSDRIYYRLIVVELKDEQSAEAGIVVNTPSIKMNRIQGSQQFYPYDAPRLEEGHRYGWQIQKIRDNVIIDKSEAWEFILASPEFPQYLKYVTLKTKGDGAIYEAIGGKVFFKMEEKYDSENLDFYILDEDMNPINEEIIDDQEDSYTSGELNVKNNGSNYYELDLGSWAKAGIYTLVVKDTRSRKYTLKFFIK